MKKAVKLLALALTLATLASLILTGCSKEETENDGNGGATPAETVLIGITNYVPMNFRDADNNWTGFETEFAQEVGKILGYNVEFIEIDWSALITEVNSGTVDAIWNGMSVIPEREDAMDISTQYMRNRSVMVARAEDAAKYTTPGGAADAIIVVENGSAMQRIVSGENSHEFFDTLQNNVTPVETQIMSLMEVLAGTADIAVVDYVKGGSLLSSGTDYDGLVIVDYLFPQNNFGIGLQKGSNDADGAKIRLDDLNAAIGQLMDSGWLMELAVKYGLGELLIVG
ncbi:MAG: transporter substrate-binding domain-containing protein [Oscillospiraceae bacterium]|nr:transporter substrate-binding domain-containing protein [Oscillospiraceae bacterium]